MKELRIISLAEIIKASPAEYADTLITGVSIDSRTAKPGDCFFAVAGENFDGHDFVADVFEKGAVCAVVNNNKTVKSSGKNILRVDDSVKALGDFARHYRKKSAFKVVAITGSVGKTTTRQIIYHVLARRFRTSQAPKNFNNHIGLPLTLLHADPLDEIVLAELGTSRPGDIEYLTRIALPDIAVITSIHPAHLEGLRNIQTIIQEKLSITKGLQPDGTLIVNADCEPLMDICCAEWFGFTAFGRSEDAHIRPQNITYKNAACRFTINSTKIELPLPGPGNLDNALAAWAVCAKFGITIDDFAEAVKTLSVIPMRAELLQAGTLTILNDCYNASPASMKNALSILSKISSHKRRRSVFICGDMAELGAQTEKLHEELGETIAAANVGLLLTVGDNAKIAADNAKKKADYNLMVKSFKDTLSACNNLQKIIKDDDIILVKGSRINKLELAVEKLKLLKS